MGARGADISHQLLESLRASYPRKEGSRSWTLFDKELVHEFLKEQHLPSQLEKYLPEDTVNPFGDTIEEILGLHPSSWELFEKMKDMIRRLAEIGKVIIVGRGSNIIAGDLPQLVHIRLTAPIEDRVARMQEAVSISPQDAKKEIYHDDRAKKKYIQKYFDKDIDDHSLYHACFNTSELRGDEIVAQVIEMVEERARKIEADK